MAEQSFYEKVYAVVRRIPHGKVTTYGAIAEFLGSKGFVGNNVMQNLLEQEGIAVKENQILNLKDVLWIPH